MQLQAPECVPVLDVTIDQLPVCDAVEAGIH